MSIDKDIIAIREFMVRVDIHMENIKPAIDEVWTTKDRVLIIETNIKNNKENAKDRKGRILSWISIAISFVVATFLGIRAFHK